MSAKTSTLVKLVVVVVAVAALGIFLGWWNWGTNKAVKSDALIAPAEDAKVKQLIDDNKKAMGDKVIAEARLAEAQQQLLKDANNRAEELRKERDAARVATEKANANLADVSATNRMPPSPVQHQPGSIDSLAFEATGSPARTIGAAVANKIMREVTVNGHAVVEDGDQPSASASSTSRAELPSEVKTYISDIDEKIRKLEKNLATCKRVERESFVAGDKCSERQAKSDAEFNEREIARLKVKRAELANQPH